MPRKLKVGSLSCELRTRRSKWLQSMVRHPQEHAHVLGALRGQVKCESEPKDCVGGVVQASANPWLRQLWEDAQALGST
eukprot:2885686-Pyramimonas_sp.AAC.1